MSPRERHCSGTIITINHNLLPIYTSLSTPCFIFFINDDSVLHLWFHFIFTSSGIFLLPFLPINMLYSLVPATSLYLLVPSAVILLSCSCTKVVPGVLQISLSSQHWAASSEGLMLLPDVPGQTIRIGHLWIRHLKPRSFNSSTDERSSCSSDFKISIALTAFTT